MATKSKEEKAAQAPDPHARMAAEGNCARCGRFARLKIDGSSACADEDRCAASIGRDQRMRDLQDENTALRKLAEDLYAQLKAASEKPASEK